MIEERPEQLQGKALRVLIIEDSEDDALLVLRALKRGGYEPQAERVQTAPALFAALARGPWDVVLSDHSMPQFGSMDALQMVQENDPDIPFIIVSGSIGEDMAVAAMRAGAHDFVMKGQPGRLVPAIERELREADIRRARRVAEDALRASEARYRELVEELPAVTYIAGLDADRTVFFISGQIDRVLGIDSEGHRHLWRRFIHPEDREHVHAVLLESIGDGRPFVAEYRMAGPSGKLVWFQDNGVVVKDGKGQPSFMRGFMLNITQRKEAELALRERDEQLRRVQKLEAIGRLAGGVAHDFNNLLTPVLGYGQILQSALRDDPALRSQADEIVKAAERAAKLTHQLLTFSRRRTEQRKPIDLNAVIIDLHRFLRSAIGEDVELVTLICEQPAIVLADATNLEQILMNLAVNARDAMGRGGRLTIRTTCESVGEEKALQFGVPAGRYVRLSVRDTGSGMSPEVREHIFEPFFTTKPEGQGTGLGLSIIYGIVKQGGGFIDVDSAPGQGSEFHLYLPHVAATAPLHEGAEVLSTPLGTETVLIVEDEEAVRELTSRLLHSLGYVVMSAASATEALSIWEEQGEKIDAVLSDVVMPHMSGRELTAILRQKRPDLPLLYMTGFARALENGQVDPDQGIPVLMKPFSRDSLGNAVRRVLDRL